MMTRTFSRLFANPRRLRRLAAGLVLAGSALGLVAFLLRDVADAGTWTYLLDSAGWILAFAGAACEARLSTILVGFQPASVRRRAALLSILGIATCLAACAVLSIISADGFTTVIRAAAAALLVGGGGAGLGGLLSLAVTSGARYAADRLAELDEN